MKKKIYCIFLREPYQGPEPMLSDLSFSKTKAESAVSERNRLFKYTPPNAPYYFYEEWEVQE